MLGADVVGQSASGGDPTGTAPGGVLPEGLLLARGKMGCLGPGCSRLARRRVKDVVGPRRSHSHVNHTRRGPHDLVARSRRPVEMQRGLGHMLWVRNSRRARSGFFGTLRCDARTEDAVSGHHVLARELR